jgi:hypothetical protein
MHGKLLSGTITNTKYHAKITVHISGLWSVITATTETDIQLSTRGKLSPVRFQVDSLMCRRLTWTGISSRFINVILNI